MEENIVCPSCQHQYTPDEIDPSNEFDYVVGDFICAKCGTAFAIQCWYMYKTTEIK